MKLQFQFRQIQVIPVCNKKDTVSFLRHSHCPGIQQKNLCHITSFLKCFQQFIYISPGIAFQKPCHIFRNHNFWSQNFSSPDEMQEQVIQSLFLLSFTEYLFFSPCFLPVTGNTEYRAWRRSIQDINIFQLLRIILPLIKIPDIHQIRILGMVVFPVKFHHGFINLTVAQNLISGQLISHRGSTPAGEAAEHRPPVLRYIPKISQSPFPRESVVS